MPKDSDINNGLGMCSACYPETKWLPKTVSMAKMGTVNCLLLDYWAEARRKLVPILRSYRMSHSKFGSLTTTIGRQFSLTPNASKMTRKLIYAECVCTVKCF